MVWRPLASQNDICTMVWSLYTSQTVIFTMPWSLHTSPSIISTTRWSLHTSQSIIWCGPIENWVSSQAHRLRYDTCLVQNCVQFPSCYLKQQMYKNNLKPLKNEGPQTRALSYISADSLILQGVIRRVLNNLILDFEQWLGFDCWSWSISISRFKSLTIRGGTVGAKSMAICQGGGVPSNMGVISGLKSGSPQCMPESRSKTHHDRPNWLKGDTLVQIEWSRRQIGR